MNVKKIAVNAARLLIAGGLLVWLIAGLKINRLAELDFGNMTLAMAAALLLMCLQVSCGAYRWKLLLQAQGIRLPLSRAISLSFQGNAFSLFLPGGALGGDVVKAAVLAAETRSGKRVEGVTTVALDRLIGMSALFVIVLIIAAAGFERLRQITPAVRWGIYTLLLLCFLGVLAVAALFFHDVVFRFKPLDFLRRKIDELTGGKLTRTLEAISLYRRERRTLLKAFLISLFFVHPCLLSVLYVILWGINSMRPDFIGSYLAIALGNSAAVIPVTPGGLGARDKIAQVVLKAFGFDAQAATLAPLCFSLILVAVGCIGLLAFGFDAFRKRREGNPPDSRR